jgi:hypothetical protein
MNADDWAQIGIFIQIGIAFFTAIAAGAAWFSVVKMAKQTKIDCIRELLSYRYDKTFFEAKKFLVDFLCRHKSDINTGMLQKGATEVHEHRQAFIAYFQKIRDFHDGRIIGDKDLQILLNTTDLEILFDIAEPIEKQTVKTYREERSEKSLELKWSKKAPALYDFYRKKCLKPNNH